MFLSCDQTPGDGLNICPPCRRCFIQQSHVLFGKRRFLRPVFKALLRMRVLGTSRPTIVRSVALIAMLSVAPSILTAGCACQLFGIATLVAGVDGTEGDQLVDSHLLAKSCTCCCCLRKNTSAPPKPDRSADDHEVLFAAASGELFGELLEARCLTRHLRDTVGIYRLDCQIDLCRLTI